MKNVIAPLLLSSFMITTPLMAQVKFDSDTIKTPSGNILITFIGHGTLMFQYNNLVIHVDPVSQFGDYSRLPKADIILVTHHHGDHLDKTALDLIRKPETDIVLTETCARQLKMGTVLKNDESKVIKGVKIEAVPAYNLIHIRDNGEPYHPRGIGNGYVITLITCDDL